MSLFCYCCLKTSILFIVLVDGYPELQAGGTIFGKRIWIRGSNKPFVFPDLHSSIFWTVCKIVSEVSQVIVNKLWTLSVTKYMPNTEEEFKSKMLDMEEMRQFPSCWAAIDGCHIPIKCPPGGKNACKEYHNYKNFYSCLGKIQKLPSPMGFAVFLFTFFLSFDIHLRWALQYPFSLFL